MGLELLTAIGSGFGLLLRYFHGPEQKIKRFLPPFYFPWFEREMLSCFYKSCRVCSVWVVKHRSTRKYRSKKLKLGFDCDAQDNDF